MTPEEMEKLLHRIDRRCKRFCAILLYIAAKVWLYAWLAIGVTVGAVLSVLIPCAAVIIVGAVGLAVIPLAAIVVPVYFSCEWADGVRWPRTFESAAADKLEEV